MRRKSPQRTRRIRNAAIVGAVVGLAIGWVAYLMSHKPFFLILFIVIGSVMATATTALSVSEYDYD